MKILFIIILFTCVATFGCSPKEEDGVVFGDSSISKEGNDIACGDPPLSREQLIDIYIERVRGRQDVDIEELNKEKETGFTIREEACAYIITCDKLMPSGERLSIKINRRGERVYTYFEETKLKRRDCKGGPLSAEQLIDIYAKEIHKRGGASIERIKEEHVFTIWKDGCNYGIGSHRPQTTLHGPGMEINRKGKVIFYTRMP